MLYGGSLCCLIEGRHALWKDSILSVGGWHAVWGIRVVSWIAWCYVLGGLYTLYSTYSVRLLVSVWLMVNVRLVLLIVPRMYHHSIGSWKPSTTVTKNRGLLKYSVLLVS